MGKGGSEHLTGENGSTFGDENAARDQDPAEDGPIFSNTDRRSEQLDVPVTETTDGLHNRALLPDAVEGALHQVTGADGLGTFLFVLLLG